MNKTDDFLNPGKEYSVLAFWFLSGTLEDKELKRQISEMTEKGVYGGFMHPRAYLKTQYLEEEWWKAISACLEEAEEKGFYPWLYDEYAWPSGTAGSTFEYGYQKPSRVLAQGEANMAKGLYCRMNDEKPICDKDCLLSRVEKDGNVYKFYYHVLEKAVDYMNPDTIREFIEITHEAYRARYASFFGTRVPGIFFDEIFMAGNPFPWTDELARRFQEKYGYDILEQLPSLVTGMSDLDKQVRRDYYELIGILYEKAFFEQISRWCGKNKLKLIGHTEEFLWEQAKRQGNYFRTMRHLMIPGSDCHDYRYQFPRKITLTEPKYAVSVARAYGKERAMSEALGGAGWNCTLQEMKKGINTLAAMGINLFILHGFYYECEHQGSQSDWPTSFFYQNPYWRHFKIFSDYIRRISFINSQGRAVVRCGIYYPVREMSEYMVNGEETVEGMKLSDAFHGVMNSLLEHQTDVDMIDRDCLLNSTFRGEKLCVGTQEFELLLFPSCMDSDDELVDKISDWKQAGGKVLVYDMDSSKKDIWKSVKRELKPYLEILQGNGEEIYTNHRTDGENHFFFVCNSSGEGRELTLGISKELCNSPQKISLLEPESGNSFKVAVESEEEFWKFNIYLESAEAVIISLSEPVEAAAYRKDRSQLTCKGEYWIAGKWEFMPVPEETDREAESVCLEIPLVEASSELRDGSQTQWLRWEKKEQLPVSLWEASWITRRPSWNDQLSAGKLYFIKDVEAAGEIENATLCIAAVEDWSLYVNGSLAAEGNGWKEPMVVSVEKWLKEGKNRLAVCVRNPHPMDAVNICSAETLPPDRLISLLLQGIIRTKAGEQQIISDHTWITSDLAGEDWFLPEKEYFREEFDVQDIRNFNHQSVGHGWVEAWERGKPPLLPWGQIPYMGQLPKYPVKMYYSVNIPKGATKIKRLLLNETAEDFVDGKELQWEGMWAKLPDVEKKHVLHIRVDAQAPEDGLTEPVIVQMEAVRMNLQDWQLNGLEFYSGCCRYRNSFDLEELTGRYWLDLGNVHFCAEVRVNGKKAETRLWAPYRLDITELLKQGKNEITIFVSNLASNERRYMLVEEGRALGWNRYWNGENMDREAGNYVSGLMGPVRILKELA